MPIATDLKGWTRGDNPVSPSTAMKGVARPPTEAVISFGLQDIDLTDTAASLLTRPLRAGPSHRFAVSTLNE